MKITQQKVLNVFWVSVVILGVCLTGHIEKEMTILGLYAAISWLIVFCGFIFVIYLVYVDEIEIFEPFEWDWRSRYSKRREALVNELLEAEREGDTKKVAEILNLLDHLK